MYPPEIRETALALVAEGRNDCEIARLTGVPEIDRPRLAVAALRSHPRTSGIVHAAGKRQSRPGSASPTTQSCLVCTSGTAHRGRNESHITVCACSWIPPTRTGQRGRPAAHEPLLCRQLGRACPGQAKGSDDDPQRVLAASAVPVPSARAGQEARAADRPRGMASQAAWRSVPMNFIRGLRAGRTVATSSTAPGRTAIPPTNSRITRVDIADLFAQGVRPTEDPVPAHQEWANRKDQVSV